MTTLLLSHNERLESLLRSNHIDCYHYTTVTTAGTPHRKLKYPPDCLITLSANAVRHCSNDNRSLLQTSSQSIAIGPATQRMLQQYNISSYIPATYSSEGILQHPLITNLPPLSSILLLCGHNPNPKLRVQLTKQGHRVQLLTTYQRQRPVIKPTLNGYQPQLIVASCRSALENLSLYLNDEPCLLQCALIVVNPRMIRIARQMGFEKDVILSANAYHLTLYNAICSWYAESLIHGSHHDTKSSIQE